MRIVYFGNNRLGRRVASWLKERGAEIVGVAIHPPARERFADEIVQSTGVGPQAVFDGSRLKEPEILSRLRALQPDAGVCVSFGYLLPRSALELFPAGCVNLHTGYLPYNRGAYPNVWSIVDATPAGVALHYVDEGVDTGDVIARREVSVEPIDTGKTLFEKLEEAALRLFQETWPLFASGRAPRSPQSPSEGTVHRVADAEHIDEIDLNRTYRAGDLINVLRARTFPPHFGAFFRDGDRRVFLSLDLSYGPAEEPEKA